MVQPTPKQMTRDQKEEKVAFFKEKLEESTVIGILDMHSLPAKQLQDIKKDMKAFANVKMSRKTLMDLAIDQADRDDVDQLKENDATQPAFIFSEKDPFQLYSLIQGSKTSAAAQGGETAPNDIEVSDGDTGIGPGPMLGKLQQKGLNVQVQDGSIHVQEPGVIIEEGEEITGEDAEILSQLGIEPLEIGLDLKVAYAGGELFTADELDIDVDQYREDIEAAAGAAFRLAVNAGVINERTAPSIIGQAVQKAKNLSISEGIPTEETIEEILAHASSDAKGLDSQLDLEAVDLEEDIESEEESEDEDSDESSETTSSEDEDAEEETEEEPDNKDESEEESDDEDSDEEDEETGESEKN